MTLARFEKIGIGPLNTRAAQGTLTPGTTYQTDEGAYLANTPYTFTAIGGGEGLVYIGPPRWVTGTEYTTGQYVISPLSWHQYIRKTNGTGTTDPANDKTNWQLVGAGGIKSLQNGILTINSTNTSASVVIQTVNPLECVCIVPLFGSSSAGAINGRRAQFSLTETELTITRPAPAGGGTLQSFYEWSITEYWS